jgi:ATP-dependent protease ClpP protease subunit
VMIYDVIGAWGISANQFVRDLNGLGAGKITVRINTPGGEVYDATAIYNALSHHDAEIVVQIEGLAASAGSYIAMSGDEVRMADNAYMMIHEARVGIMGEAKDLRKHAELLEKMNDNISGIYDQKAGKGKKYWRNLMSEETWFTAEEAKAEGLVDSVYSSVSKAEALITKAPFNFADYKKMPAAVRDMLGIPQDKISAPDAATSVADEAGSSCQQKGQEMADNTTSPAQSTVAATDSVPVENDLSKDIAGLQKITHAGIFNQGKQAGIEVGVQQAMERFKAILAACPGKPQMAIDAIEGGHTPEAVKLAFAAEARADARAEAAAKEQQRQISTLQALVATGGTSGLSMAMGIVDSDDEPRMAPKDQAEWEWENKPSVRKTAKDKATFMFARIAELDGSHRSFTRDPVSA